MALSDGRRDHARSALSELLPYGGGWPGMIVRVGRLAYAALSCCPLDPWRRDEPGHRGCQRLRVFSRPGEPQSILRFSTWDAEAAWLKLSQDVLGPA